MKSCNNCGLPETYETFEFDENQICNVCTQHKTKNTKVDWKKKREILVMNWIFYFRMDYH